MSTGKANGMGAGLRGIALVNKIGWEKKVTGACERGISHRLRLRLRLRFKENDNEFSQP
jgi:hypothetical protein